MPALPLLASVLCTVAIVCSGTFCLHRCVAHASGTTVIDRVNDATHVFMSAEMVAMAWSWRLTDLWGLQVAAFATAAAWFVIQAVGAPTTLVALRPAAAFADQTSTGSTPCRGRPGHSGNGATRRTAYAHHAILMLVMIWMLGLPTRARVATAMGAMPMSQGDGSAHVIGVVIGAYCLLVAPLWLLISVRERGRRRGAALARELVTYPLMSAAMGAMVLLLA